MIPRHLLIGVSIMLVTVIAMSVYFRRMRVRSAQIQAAVADTRPIAPPVAGPTEDAILYVAYDNPGLLLAQTARIPLPAGRQQRAQELLRALLTIYLDKFSPHPLAPGAEVRDVYMVDPGLVVIDTNAVFAEGHRSGVLVEELTVASLVQTLSANIPGITRVKILVDGKERDTLAGHADLSDFYDVTAVSKLVTQMQAPL